MPAVKKLGGSLRPPANSAFGDPEESAPRAYLFLIAMFVSVAAFAGIFTWYMLEPKTIAKSELYKDVAQVRGFLAKVDDESIFDFDCPCSARVRADDIGSIMINQSIAGLQKGCEEGLAGNPAQSFCDVITQQFESKFIETTMLPSVNMAYEYEFPFDVAFAYEDACLVSRDEWYFKDYAFELYFELMGVDISSFWGTNYSDVWINGIDVSNNQSWFNCTFNEADVKDGWAVAWEQYVEECNPKACQWSEYQGPLDIFLATLAIVGTVNSIAILIAGLVYGYLSNKDEERRAAPPAKAEETPKGEVALEEVEGDDKE
uniref:Uncharacterized protein n=1 Tax=Sexangularia sp. CB-2014 TaxID=1486929 RepID=A0A7S1YKK2_9EUKA